MVELELFFIYSLLVQLAHSGEELLTGFHKKWYLFKMPFWVFFAWELFFSVFWVAVLLNENLPYRAELQKFLLILMFANGVQHLVWWGSVKKYVPGLVTAFLHIIVFMIFYFKTI